MTNSVDATCAAVIHGPRVGGARCNAPQSGRWGVSIPTRRYSYEVRSTSMHPVLVHTRTRTQHLRFHARHVRSLPAGGKGSGPLARARTASHARTLARPTPPGILFLNFDFCASRVRRGSGADCEAGTYPPCRGRSRWLLQAARTCAWQGEACWGPLQPYLAQSGPALGQAFHFAPCCFGVAYRDWLVHAESTKRGPDRRRRATLNTQSHRDAARASCENQCYVRVSSRSSHRLPRTATPPQ